MQEKKNAIALQNEISRLDKIHFHPLGCFAGNISGDTSCHNTRKSFFL
jgi:hypothetical protein